MSEPKIASLKPEVVDLDPGTYYWCACGYSANQPYCDGAHREKGFRPLVFEIEEKKKVALCNCKRTATPPFCDGAHSRIEE
ncbi:MAG: CDGSH iron-sulfur domain-containing protein [Candidatus Hydrogenedentota bacterium]|nr:MAG: CDGSH iron-sulfur domain-containing protein [Candidatus Hydrogenedentota bacterium]